MSVNARSPQQAERRERCEYCGTHTRIPEMTRGSFCSPACYYRHRGASILDQIQSDHTICATCYRPVKEVERVPDEINTAATGFQHPTPQTTISVDDRDRDGRARGIEYTRWGCECGAVNPQDTLAALQNANLKRRIADLYYCLERLARKGAIAHSPDRDAYFDALREHWHDAAYAAGRAVYAHA
jgi:hypothetical protein